MKRRKEPVYIEPVIEDTETIRKRDAFYAPMKEKAQKLGGTYRTR